MLSMQTGIKTRADQAREVARELASRGAEEGLVLSSLRGRGLDGTLSNVEVERFVREAAMARKFKSDRGVHRLFRLFGVVVIIAGVLALETGTKLAIAAIVFGLMLVFHPECASDDAGIPWR
jgi:hypothetical protein